MRTIQEIQDSLIEYSDEPTQANLKSMVKLIKDKFRSNPPLKYTDQEISSVMSAVLKNIAKHQSVDLFILLLALGAPLCNFDHKHYSVLFSNKPLLFKKHTKHSDLNADIFEITGYKDYILGNCEQEPGYIEDMEEQLDRLASTKQLVLNYASTMYYKMHTMNRASIRSTEANTLDILGIDLGLQTLAIILKARKLPAELIKKVIRNIQPESIARILTQNSERGGEILRQRYGFN